MTIFTVPVIMPKIKKILSFVEIMILADNNKDAKVRFQIHYESVSRGQGSKHRSRRVGARLFLLAHQLAPSGRWIPGWGRQLFMHSKTISS